jgi:hypothetical protein
MRTSSLNHLVMILAFFLAGCGSNDSSIITSTRPVIPTATVVSLPTATITPLPSLTPTPTITATIEIPPSSTPTPIIAPQATLEPTEAAQVVLSLIRDEVSCQAPCIWGIVPEQTTLTEASSILTRLGLNQWIDMDHGTAGGYIEYNDGLEVSLGVGSKNDIVEKVELGISPSETSQEPRAWLAYSPETLINQYGNPSNVYLFLGRGPLTGFVILMYFEQVNISILYYFRDLGDNNKICPITDEFDSIDSTLGESKLELYSDGVSLEKGTGMTIEEFSNKMTGDPSKACFYIKPDNFP